MKVGNEVPPCGIYCHKGVCILYDIMMDTKVVGQAEVIKEGLYYRFACKCTPPNDEVHRIVVSDGNNSKDLGICVPEGGWFCLVSRTPIKHLPGEKLQFALVPQNKQRTMIPVATDEPFPALDKLDSAKLQETEEDTQILIDPTPNQPDNDPSQESPHKWERP